MSTSIWIIDAFTSVPFKGNPAAICLLDSFPDAAAMQQVAMEMNLSETAFLVNTAPLHYDLRWFTPTVEVNLCGHATLAATHMLRETGHLQLGDCVTYHTQSGALKARVKESGIVLDFPLLAGKPVSPHPALEALGVEILSCEKNRDNYLIEVIDYQALLTCTPDFRMLANMDMQGVIVTTAKDVPGYDFASRYFGPGAGIDEDPVTGSAHCFLAPYWAKKLNKTTFHALQASKREGVLDVSLAQDRVLIRGQAVTTLKAELQLPLSRNQEKAA